MNKRKWKKEYLAGILAAAMAAAGLWTLPASAARAIETDRTGSLTIGLGENGEYAQDLMSASLDASLYFVAQVDRQGNYTLTEDFEDLGFSFTDETTAQDWEQMSQEAGAWVEAQEEAGTPVEPYTQVTVENGEAMTGGLPLGLYLLTTEDADTALYSYTFAPALVAVPGNTYRQDGTGDDEWIYDMTVGLKPERESRYGSLRIVKMLDEYNSALGPVTFVFQIEGTDSEGNTVYSNAAATTHSSAGVQEVLIQDLPAGTTVTVTEVYSGASYTLTSQGEQTVTIAADEEMAVTFSNTYNDELTPGSGAVNRFDYDENSGWQWSRQDGGIVGE